MFECKTKKKRTLTAGKRKKANRKILNAEKQRKNKNNEKEKEQIKKNMSICKKERKNE